MLRIRLSRRGYKKAPFYRIVVTESSVKRGGKNISIIGTYNKKSKSFDINRKKYDEYVAKGAQPSLALQRLLGEAK